jgi:hypothetical protein
LHDFRIFGFLASVAFIQLYYSTMDSLRTGGSMIGNHLVGHKPQRRVVVAAAAASILLAIGAPVVHANPGTGGTVPNHHTHTGGAVTPTGKLTSAVTPTRIASSGSPTPTVRLPAAAVTASPTPTVDLSTAAITTPASPPDLGRPVCAGRPAFGLVGQRRWPLTSCPLQVTTNTGFGASFAVLGNGNPESGSNSVLSAPLSAGLFGANFAFGG